MCYMIVKMLFILRAFENSILTGLFWHKKDENGEWRMSTKRKFISSIIHLI